MKQKKQKNLKIGDLGEKFITKWLRDQGWNILASRWRCLWGEIDIIAQKNQSNSLVFIEVKTRSNLNLDRQGIDSITLAKQEKIVKSAELFLAENPQFADYFLRFDVALVAYQNLPNLLIDENCFKLINYLESAFEVD